MDFKLYKFPCTQVPNLLGSARENRLPTEKQLQKAINILNKEHLLSITKTDVNDLLIVINKYIDYSPNKASSAMVAYLCDIYSNEVFGVDRIIKFQENSNRSYQIGGIKNEPVAYDLLHKFDGIRYEKNKKVFENDYFIGKPDSIYEGAVKEIKTLANYSDFLYLVNSKPGKDDQYQLQCYMDLADTDSGEIIYVATGLNPSEHGKYAEIAKKWYTDQGLEPELVAKKVKRALKNCILDGIPISQRIKRYAFKKNPQMISFAKKRVTFARNLLYKWHEKFNKIVDLLGDNPKE